MNTITEIQTALDELAAAMVERGLINPRASFELNSGAKAILWLKSESLENYELFRGDADQCFDKARAYIAALPDPAEAGMREYLRDVAKAIDTGTRHSIDDKYVTPLRGVTKAMTSNLLSKEAAE